MFASHPGLEVHYAPEELTFWSTKMHTTDIDLIERFSDRTICKRHLDHVRLIEHLAHSNDIDPSMIEEPITRIFFLNDLDFLPKLDNAPTAFLEPDTTTLWLQQRFNVTPLFFRFIRDTSVLVEGRKTAFLNCDEDNKPVSLDGFYSIWLGTANNFNTSIWFSHDLHKHRSTYMIYNLLEGNKGAILDLYGQDYYKKGRPPTFALDVLMARMGLVAVQKGTMTHLQSLLALEQQTSVVQSRPDELVATAHETAKAFHANRSSLATLELVLAFLKDTNERWHKLDLDYEGRDKFQEMCFNPTQESLRMLAEELDHSAVWITNFIDRCSVRINLLFNIATQMDNHTNYQISQYTSKISEATQRDSASMITMAVVTMFFLPGTFVSAIFGMSFFEQNSGGDRINVTNDWNLYLIITIPLTIVVFIVWGLWRYLRLRWQKDKHSESTTSSDTAAQPVREAIGLVEKIKQGLVGSGRTRKRGSDSQA